MRLSSAHFNNHLTKIGQAITWRRSFACACVNPTSGAPDPRHTVCAGKGRIWSDPVVGVIGLAAQKITPQMAAMGVWEQGDMVATIPASSAMWADAGRFDRVIMQNSTHAFDLVLTHGAPTEKILAAVESISRCFWLDPTTRAIIDGGIPVVSSDGLLSWPNGGEPLAGVTYSLAGRKFDEYYIFDQLPSTRNEHSGEPLPKKLQLRKWDLFGR
jgi:hypothetical protein